ncbi:hypothetical protein KMW28_15630 [Flammeovirga yaeyamensis]|uniref:GyrI-like small molecule binding domain-containing protein n=1 Tax=Flammeovirga yaeyamensis TaxID=367791 RepID=A0AAX1N173_9BACT|nr:MULTISPECIES: hypothetical protein [Flammeovirga]ANQ47517.1 hypothetical protein MY04_0135 [Flammeovirga sp. MY04]MBB3698556.1 hypothetical protein [Flammeovirga yaeyamensis]NMF34095.1 hypothetical protein [Flammeovirga yaeyamensis]QWG01082.1 hypothetical protein KMW28_15630 [Flammeovirga yaeyamensis]
MGKNKWIFILLGFISLGIIAILSGVFVDIEINERAHDSFVIKGYEYEGDISKKAFMHLYDSISNQKSNGTLEGNLAVLFFTHPNEIKKAKVIVGVIGNHSVQDSLFSTYEQKAFKEVYSVINLGELFTPNPSNVVDAIDLYTKEKNLKGNKYLEYYSKETQVIQSVIIE